MSVDSNGGPEHVETDPDQYPDRQPVESPGRFPRSTLSQGALNEFGSAPTLFKVKRHKDVFVARAGLLGPPGNEAEDETATLTVSQQVEEATANVAIRRLCRV